MDMGTLVAECGEAIWEGEQLAGVAVLSIQGARLSGSEVAQWCGG